MRECVLCVSEWPSAHMCGYVIYNVYVHVYSYICMYMGVTCVYACVYVYICGVCMYTGVYSCQFMGWVACCSVLDPFGEI